MQVFAVLASEANLVNTQNQLGAVNFDDLEWAPGSWQDLSHVLVSALVAIVAAFWLCALCWKNLLCLV